MAHVPTKTVEKLVEIAKRNEGRWVKQGRDSVLCIKTMY